MHCIGLPGTWNTTIVAIESSLKLMPLRPGPNYCSCEWITLIFDIFRIGVVTGYRKGMLNLFNLFGLKRLAHLSQFHIVLFYVLWFHVLLFHVLQFHVLSLGPSFSRPAISCPAHWSSNFMSCYFMPCKLVRQFHVRHFYVQHFQRPLFISQSRRVMVTTDG